MRYLIVVFLCLPIIGFAKNCPEFDLSISIKKGDISKNIVEIAIQGGHSNYSADNFIIKLNEGMATVDLHFDYDKEFKNGNLTYRNLISNKKAGVKEYTIFFADEQCKGGRLIEVGSFQIR